MYSRLILVPAAIVAMAPATTAADQLQTLEAAQQRLVARGDKLTPADFKLTPEQFERLKAEYDVPSFRPAVRAWRLASGGWLFLDQVYGLNDVITYLAAIGKDGKVRGIEILTCAEGYCDLYTREWRASFAGLAHGKWEPRDTVPMVSGSTLSSSHVAEGVKKLLAIHARFLPAVGAP